MDKLNEYIDEIHKTATGLALLSYVMGVVGILGRVSLTSAWFGMTKIIFGLSAVAFFILFVLMFINAIKK